MASQQGEPRQRQMRPDVSQAAPPGSHCTPATQDQPHPCTLIIEAAISSGQDNVYNPCPNLSVIMTTLT